MAPIKLLEHNFVYQSKTGLALIYAIHLAAKPNKDPIVMVQEATLQSILRKAEISGVSGSYLTKCLVGIAYT